MEYKRFIQLNYHVEMYCIYCKNLNSLLISMDAGEKRDTQASPFPFTGIVFTLHVLIILCDSSHTAAGLPLPFLNRSWASQLRVTRGHCSTVYCCLFTILYNLIKFDRSPHPLSENKCCRALTWLHSCTHRSTLCYYVLWGWIQGSSVWSQWQQGLSFSRNLHGHNEGSPHLLTFWRLWSTRGLFFCCQHQRGGWGG